MRLFIEKLSRKIYTDYLLPHSRISYAQNGEDLIVRDLLSKLNITKATYLDIGANEPVYISNTYLLYSKGCRGVCIEPNRILYNKLKHRRPLDTSINAGVAFDERNEADFYLFGKKASGLGTFSKKEAEFWQHTGNTIIGKHAIATILKMPLVNINVIMDKYFSPHPNFISIDVEGLDLQILETIDFNKYTPEIFCVETLGYDENGKEEKNTAVTAFLSGKGYFVYADTYINTIFCREKSYAEIK